MTETARQSQMPKRYWEISAPLLSKKGSRNYVFLETEPVFWVRLQEEARSCVTHYHWDALTMNVQRTRCTLRRMLEIFPNPSYARRQRCFECRRELRRRQMKLARLGRNDLQSIVDNSSILVSHTYLDFFWWLTWDVV